LLIESEPVWDVASNDSELYEEKQVLQEKPPTKQKPIILPQKEDKWQATDMQEVVVSSRPKKKKIAPILSEWPVISTTSDDLPDWLK
jgi:hypothetical protein